MIFCVLKNYSVEDCPDGTDEDFCPLNFNYDTCVDSTGDPMCYWHEIEIDHLEWTVENINQTKDLEYGPTAGENHFLFVEWLSMPDDNNHNAITSSPLYQDSASSCTLSLMYYVVGREDTNALLVSLRQDDIRIPIDFLHVESIAQSEFHYREITVGRRPKDVQVCKHYENAINDRRN